MNFEDKQPVTEWRWVWSGWLWHMRKRRPRNGVIKVLPKLREDPIYKLGKNPVPCKAPDASENLDRYLYAIDE